MEIRNILIIGTLLVVSATALQSDDDDCPTDNKHQSNVVTTYDKRLHNCCCGTVQSLNRTVSREDQHCCGKQVYNNKTHDCCGNVIYKLNSNFGCCNDVVYTKTESKCCMTSKGNEITDIPEDMRQQADTECCGSNVYDSTTHTCCLHRPGKDISVFPDYEEVKYFYTEGEHNRRQEDLLNTVIGYTKNRYYRYLYDAYSHSIITHQQRESATCESREVGGFRVSLEKLYEAIEYDEPIFGQCNNTPFNIFSHVCCSITKHNGNYIITHSKLHLRKSNVIECCGLESYDFRTHICCNDSTIHAQNGDASLRCCKHEIYDSNQYVCCEGSSKLLPIESLPDGTNKCCGERFYSQYAEACCGGNVISRKRLPSFMHPAECINIDFSFTCPKSTESDTQNYVCCGGKYELRKNSTNDDMCCGSTTYTFHRDKCCQSQGILNSKQVNAKVYYGVQASDRMCCGVQIYNTAYQRCCNGTIINNSNELCCDVGNKTVVVQTKFNGERCCGGSAFDPKTERCCNGNVLEAPANYLECCGSNVYDPKEELCCDDKLYSPQNKKRMKCCGDKMIDSFKQICCNGSVKDVVNPLKESCCYSKVV